MGLLRSLDEGQEVCKNEIRHYYHIPKISNNIIV